MRIDKKETGKRLRKLREDSNLTLAEVASQLGVSGKSTVNAWEKGRAYPKKHIDELAKMYGATVDYLNYGDLGGQNMEFDTVKEALEWLIEVNRGGANMNEEERQVAAEIIVNLEVYKEDIRRITTKLALYNASLEDSYGQTVDGSLLYRVYGKEVKQQVIMKAKNVVNELVNLMALVEDVSDKVAKDIVEG